MKFLILVVRCALLLVAGLATLTILFPQWLDFSGALIAEQRAKNANAHSAAESKGPPKDWNVQITGNITSGARYRVSVLYSANSEAERCQRFASFFNEPKGKWLHYNPKVEQGKHAITVPLNAYKPRSSCLYEPEVITLDVSRNVVEPTDGDKLFYKRESYKSFNFDDYGQQALVSELKLSLECAPTVRDGKAFDAWSCKQNDYSQNILIAQPLPNHNTIWRIDISLLDERNYAQKVTLQKHRYQTRNSMFDGVRLIKGFYTVVNRDPTAEEANAIMRKGFDIDEFANDKNRHVRSKFIEKQQDYFTRSLLVGEAVKDAWGNPIQLIMPARHSEQRFELFSLGADAVESEDDVWVDSQFKTNIP